jgi:enoyl-[acyl-carrier protein] reductase II
VRCIRTPEIVAYEEALARNADAGEVSELKSRVRGSRNETSKADRRQSAAGQRAGMIRHIVPVRDLIDGMMAEAAQLLPSIAKG